MPSNLIKSFAEKTGKTEQEVEKLWNKAKTIALEKMKETEEGFYAYVTGILKKMLSIEEETNSTAVEIPQNGCGTMPCGTPYYTVDDDLFFTLHLKKREKGQWYNKHYKDSAVADFARRNPRRSFYLKHRELGMFRKIK